MGLSDWITSSKNADGCYEVTEVSLPSEFKRHTKSIIKSFHHEGDSYSTILKLFLRRVKALGLREKVPDYMTDAVVLKIMYEYHRKYGSLRYPLAGDHTLTEAEILRPLHSREKQRFWTFCQKHAK